MTPLRVLIVEDSRTVRERLVEVLREDPGFQVVGQVGDGVSAIRLCERLRPDVISLDMVLPGMSGLEVTQRIMATRATPILVVSASINRGEAFDALDALNAGAVDIFEKSRMLQGTQWEEELKGALRLVSRIRVVTRARAAALPDSVRFRGSESRLSVAKECSPDTVPERESVLSATDAGQPRIVALGASTGGPAALAAILGQLPLNFRLPVLVVLHMAVLFAPSLVEWLGRQSALKVSLARDGDPVPLPGAGAPVILAPPGRHLIVEAGKLRLSNAPERHSCRPSADVLFESIALEYGARAVAGVLTGMGRDGALGLLRLRRLRAMTFAQDEATSAVFGMPHEAIQVGAVELVLPLEQIAGTLVQASLSVGERSSGGCTPFCS
ncbi:MAG TPA: chemotaxis-specific protein-glutamate methyltransferase CheB [Polyangiaceae bacterium]|nr:chemotaxis-specific protein-glutamate methyltransferase CheB [Polyangiaceae bacterium]